MLAADAQALAAQTNARPFVGLSHGPFRRYPENDNASIHTGRPTKAAVTPLVRPKPVAPEKVLQAFNTWAFKREQPDTPQSMLAAVAECGP